MSDLINRIDAIDAMFDANPIDKEYHYYKHIAIEALESVPSVEADDRLYIKVYADDEPSVKAEKLYQICEETENKEIAEWLKEYFPSVDKPSGEWQRKEKECNDCDGHRAYYWYECSECDARPPNSEWKQEWHSPYCPSCEARMKGGDTK